MTVYFITDYSSGEIANIWNANIPPKEKKDSNQGLGAFHGLAIVYSFK